MKKTKKLLALLMVLAIMLSVAALPASAVQVVSCSVCGQTATFDRRVKNEKYGSVPVAENLCQYLSEAHTHNKVRAYDTFKCESCGNILKVNYTYSVVCPYE